MGGVQCGGDLLDDVDGAFGSSGPVLEQGVQVDAVDEPHGDVEPAVDLADVVDRDDVGVVEACRGAGFAAEPLSKSGSLANWGSSVLIATTRSMVVSWARQTSPIPPRPSSSISW